MQIESAELKLDTVSMAIGRIALTFATEVIAYAGLGQDIFRG